MVHHLPQTQSTAMYPARRRLQQIKQILLPLLYPVRCPVCGTILPYGQLICQPCRSRLPFIYGPVCCRCGKPIERSEQEYCYDCRIFPKTFRSGCSLMVYNEISRPMMMNLKYHNIRTTADYLSAEILRRHKRILQNWNLDMIVPIPIHKNKKKIRGYNQAALLCISLALEMHLPCCCDLLLRTVDTLPQKQFSPQARLTNLRKAFTLNPFYREQVRTLHSVLLVDDIYTTGATMEACTRILTAAGVHHVFIYSACIGVSRD